TDKIRPIFRRSQLVYLDGLYGDENYSLSLISKATRRETVEIINLGKRFCSVQLVSINERLRILNYLCQNAEKTGFNRNDLLFYAHFSEDREMIELLKNKGAVVPENRIKMITEGGNNDDWLSYCWIVHELDDEQFFRVLNALIAECGSKKLHFTELFWEYNKKRFEKREFFKFLLENFNQSKMNKTKLMKGIIERGDAECLALCAENGWLKMPRKRDEMIAYAESKGKTEVVAYLLDFKNRTADLAAEREKAEKKAERELNADPFSVTELKKQWKYEKQTDGTIMITGYKGNALEIAVPARIGKAPVTAVGKRAFSPNALRITEEQALVRCRITKIIVPEGVRTIGEEAFGGAGACRAVKGFFNAFSDLREVVLPSSLEAFSSREAAESAPRVFVNCRLLTVKVPHTPYTETFCRSQNVDFEFYGV
ncbi:MAG: leucine-rich repeat domain-containing protein, partial [Oscillospiraceae bacterium]|nr:leucine-rich repeat domain-containing protein [Oscillospiraceae bacterium]